MISAAWATPARQAAAMPAASILMGVRKVMVSSDVSH
ncbi:Uncharacterised protein [Bordetella pertussis]|nr:Uncharacterised protein [Bordetella pertussis]